MVTLSVTLCFDLITAVAAGFVTAALAGARQLERLEMDRIVSAPLLDQVFLGSGNDEFSARVGLVRLQGSFTVASARKLIRVIAAATLRASMAVIYSPIRSTRTIGGRCLSRGKTKREAIRALKRRISDRIWTHLNTTPLTQELS